MNIAGFRSKSHVVRTPTGDLRLTVATLALSNPRYMIEMVKRQPKGQANTSTAMVLTLRRDGRPMMSSLVPGSALISAVEEAQRVLITEANRLAGEEA